MVTVAGPRRIYTGFLLRCAFFGGGSPNRTSGTEHTKSLSCCRPGDPMRERPTDVTKVEMDKTLAAARMTL